MKIDPFRGIVNSLLSIVLLACAILHIGDLTLTQAIGGIGLLLVPSALKMPPSAASALAFVAMPFFVACGMPAPTTPQVQGLAESGCTIVSAFVNDPRLETVCAGASDLIDIGSAILKSRADAGPARHVTACRFIPTTEVCASESETAAAIRAFKASRPDGG